MGSHDASIRRHSAAVSLEIFGVISCFMGVPLAALGAQCRPYGFPLALCGVLMGSDGVPLVSLCLFVASLWAVLVTLLGTSGLSWVPLGAAWGPMMLQIRRHSAAVSPQIF